MCQRFIHSDDKKIITEIMTKAENYHEFVIHLGNYASTEEVRSELAHLAIVHAWELRETNVIEEIASRYGQDPFVKPWTYPIRTRSDRLSVSHHIRDAVDLAMYDNPSDWMKMNLLLLKSYALLHTPEGPSALDEAKTLLESSSDLSCYSPYILHIECRIRYEEGNLTEAVPICKNGLEQALENDNLYQAVWLYRWLGMFMMNTDPRQAAQHLEEAYNIAKSLGTPFHTAAALIDMAWIYLILGEYDLALAFYDESRTLSASLDEVSDRHAVTISHIYCDLDDPRQALDWAEWALEWHMNQGSEGDSWTHLAIARALTLLGRFDEATEHLDTGKEMAYRSGQEREIAFYYLVSGIHEIYTGNPASAIESIRGALEICERTSTQLYVNRSLLALTRAEIELYKLERSDETSNSSGVWMTYLEDTARERNLPGLMIQHALLKAEFLLLQRRISDARNTLIDALDIYHSPGVRSLKNQVLKKIQEIDTSN
jgi:tetratricopeptide (TPR) repeat protein